MEKDILEEIRYIRGAVDDLRESFSQYRETTSAKIAVLNVKAGIWGLLAGLIPVIILVTVEWLKVKTPF